MIKWFKKKFQKKLRSEQEIINEAIHARQDDTVPRLVNLLNQAMEDLKSLFPNNSPNFFNQHVVVPFYIARIITLTELPVSKELINTVRENRKRAILLSRKP